jgi:exonuclease SbcC
MSSGKYRMKLLPRFLIKKFARVNLVDSIQALDAQPNAVLESIVDDASGVYTIDMRIAAMARLPYALVIRCEPTALAPSLKQAAFLRLAEIADENADCVAKLMADVKDTESLLMIAGHCKTQTLQNEVLNTIQDQRLLTDICVQATSARTRKMLAERIDHPTLLDLLLIALKDKTAYHIIKKKVDKLKAQQKAVVLSQQKTITFCEKFEHHSVHVFDKDYEQHLNWLRQQWVDLEHKADLNTQQRVCSAQAICQQRLDEKSAEVQRHKNLATAAENRQDLLQDYWLHINALYAEEVMNESIVEQTHKKSAEFQQAWLALTEYGSLSKHHLNSYTQLRTLVETLLARFQQHGTLQVCHARIQTQINDVDVRSQIAEGDIRYLNELLSLTDTLETAKEFVPEKYLLECRATLSAINEQQQQQQHLISQLIRQSRNAIESGQLKKALAIHHAIEEKWVVLAEVPQYLSTQKETLTLAVEQLLDWQVYAVLPKKQALIVAMEKLIGVDLLPATLANKIKYLQKDWRQLKQSGGDRQPELWEQFSQAADKAYQPCKIYYRQCDAERQQNLVKQHDLIQQLQDYEQQNNWENIDAHQVENILSVARKELHANMPVAHKEHSSVLASFYQAVKPLQDKIEAAYTQNKITKDQLIQQAEKLAANTDIDQAIEQAKHLQAQWRNLPDYRYKGNQKLWRIFNQHCNLLYKKKTALKKESDAQFQRKLDQCSALIDTMQSYQRLTGEALLDIRHDFAQLIQSFEDIGELPDKQRHSFSKTIFNTKKQFEEQVIQTLIQRERQSWQTLFTMAEEINAHQRAALAASDAELHKTIEPQRQTMQDDINQQSHWPESGRSAINAKIAQLAQTDTSNEQDRQQSLRLLCIRAEILANTESPALDRQLRMQYQINILAQGMNRATDTSNAQALAWIAIGGVEAPVYQTLFERFQHSWKMEPSM